jgi:hypothetical protein
MKSVLRKMQIDNQAFLYRVTSLNAHWVKLKIWSASQGSKNNLIQVRLRFDDPWLNLPELYLSSSEERNQFALEPITPKQVRQIIEAAIAAGWDTRLARENTFYDGQDDLLLKTEEAF